MRNSTGRPDSRRLGHLSNVAVLIGLTLTSGVAAAVATPTVAAAASPISLPVSAVWNMSETSGTVMNDSGPNNIDGTIGSAIALDGSDYSWAFTSPTLPPPKPERLALVPQNDLLDPGNGDFAVEFRYRTTYSFGNLVQKGQNGSVGGYWKFEQPSGFMTCLFKENETTQIGVKSPIQTNDGQFHTIRCERRAAFGVIMFIDGVEVAKKAGTIGIINNDVQLSIAGKSNCDQGATTCDYFTGDIDYVRIEKGASTNVAPSMTFTSSCTNLTCAFDGRKSVDPDGTITTYEWDFGDGTAPVIGTNKRPSHTYATAGTYQVTLTGTDDDGALGAIVQPITTNLPPAMTFTAVCGDRTCEFNSGASTDPDGVIEARSWAFGDGKTATGVTASHTYATKGIYTVTVTGTDDDGAKGTATQEVPVALEPPAMSFTVSCNQLACSFDSAASSDPDGNIARRVWNFGDGATSTALAPTHTFASTGTFEVTLTGTDDDGLVGTATKSVSVSTSVVLPPIQGATRFIPLAPERVFDTRPGQGPAGKKGVVAGGTTLTVDVTGVAGVPASGVAAVAINLTVVGIGAPSFVTAWPTGTTRPNASTLNIVNAGQVRANLAVVPVGSDGTISLYTKADADLLGDIAGYYTSQTSATRAGRTIVQSPQRLFDTRSSTDPGLKGPVAGRAAITVPVAGRAGVPASGASAVVLNVTATGNTGRGFVTVWDEGAIPTASVINLNNAGESVPNMVIVPIGSDGSIRLSPSVGTHLLADVLGYVTGPSAASSVSGLFVPMTPTRVFDTRPEELPTLRPKGLIPAKTSIRPEIAGAVGIPNTAGAVLLNLTMVGTAPGYATLFPAGADRPTTSNVNVNGAGDVRPNGAMVALGDGGDLEAYVLTPAHLLADVAGWFIS